MSRCRAAGRVDVEFQVFAFPFAFAVGGLGFEFCVFVVGTHTQ